jgi:hypothetical protein
MTLNEREEYAKLIRKFQSEFGREIGAEFRCVFTGAAAVESAARCSEVPRPVRWSRVSREIRTVQSMGGAVSPRYVDRHARSLHVLRFQLSTNERVLCVTQSA